jgi:methylated-DNA-protein-cysteine methyltransferase related protein
MDKTFSEKIRSLINAIPPGKVATYGQIAAYAGNPWAARHVARVLHSSSRKYNLPWHRVINGRGKISLPHGNGYEIQKELLVNEGIIFNKNETIDLDLFLYNFP